MSSPNIRARTNKTKAAWRAAPDKELSRLCSDNKTSNWKLPGGIIQHRTRGKKKEGISDDDLSSEASETISLLTSSVETPPEEDEEDSKGAKTSATRAIMETAGLKELFLRTAKCGACGGPVEVKFPTCCIATFCRLVCADPMCTWQDDSSKPAPTNFPLSDTAGSPLIERTTDYAANVLYVLSHLACGDGGREAEKHLTLLDLPNSTTMERSSFSAIEERIGPSIRELNEEILKENLIMEVEAVMMQSDNEDFDAIAFDYWKQASYHRW